MSKRIGSRSKNTLDYLSGFMGGLRADQKRLTEIQATYDNLSLLGQLLCSGTDISRMREDFNKLASQLLDQLAREHYQKAALNLDSCARVAIDILTRNLFERTADIGFLASDAEIRAFAEATEAVPAAGLAAERQALQAHFAEYVRKYSVYHNIILLSPTGDVLAQLDEGNPVAHSVDPLLHEALTTEQAYVEVFRPTDLLPGETSPLVYAYRVMAADGSRPLGVLCLCFRFQDECRRIFDSLIGEDEWTVITLLDAQGRVIASSDPYQFPAGVQLEIVDDAACRVVRFAGREYLATSRPTQGYQGYAGPGWVGHALAPLNHAFEMAEAHELEQVPEDFLDGVLETSILFSPELRDIPLRATSIQRELNRAVWNGYVWLVRDALAAQNADFAKVLLREIGSTGVRTHQVFSESTDSLYKTVVSSALSTCTRQAALAIELMDRNLYERANDCRWWALTRSFREELAQADPHDKAQRQRLSEVLRRINGLYTVYSNLILFDQSGRVLAVSNPAYQDWLGKILSESWVRPALGLADAQSYNVSGFEPSALYDNQSTYIYAAGVRAADDEPVGGIAIVFDATPQFRAMLHDALPRRTDGQPVAGAFAVFAGRDGRVIAATDPDLPPGSRLMIGYEFFKLQAGDSCTNVVIYNGCYYAVGSSMSAGYREYQGAGDGQRGGVVALVFSPLSDRIVDAEQLAVRRDTLVDTYARRPLAATVDSVDVACFYVGSNWYGVRSSHVVEAVDTDRLTPLPGVSEALCGCLMYRDQAISVFDLSAILSSRQPATERRRANRGGKQQIVVLQVPEQQARFGILVDHLGAVSEIPAVRIETLPGMLSEGNSPIESLVKPHADDVERRILMVLSASRMLHRLGGSSLTSGAA